MNRERYNAKTCSLKCNRIHNYHPEFLPTYCKSGLPKGTVGTISEYLVATDLLIKGYEVFKALSSHTSCDLAISIDSKLYRVEVKTKSKKVNGEISKYVNKKQLGKHDILAIVTSGNEIFYEPKLNGYSANSEERVNGNTK